MKSNARRNDEGVLPRLRVAVLTLTDEVALLERDLLRLRDVHGTVETHPPNETDANAEKLL